MFTVAYRDEVREGLIAMARRDHRVVAGAEVGSLTQTSGDRWSDLDLTFGIGEEWPTEAVLSDWTDHLRDEWGAVHLFDLQALSTTYRVFLFPGNLQVDLSVTPGAASQMGPKFRMLFGTALRRDTPEPLHPRHVFGLCVHHAVRARFSIDRGRVWASLYWLGELRNETLSLACLLRDLPGKYARGFDELPAGVVDRASASLARSTDGAEIMRALTAAIALLVDEASAADGLPDLEAWLRELTVAEIDT